MLGEMIGLPREGNLQMRVMRATKSRRGTKLLEVPYQEVAAGQSSCCSVVRGRGRGRGRGRPRGSGRGAERDGARSDRFEDDPDTSPQHDNNDKPRDLKFSEEDLDVREQKETGACNRSHTGTVVRNFDLNLDWDENGDMSAAAAAVSTVITAEAAVASSSAEYGMKHEEYPGLPLSDMDKMAINPLLNGRLYEEDEDYDNEEGWVFE